jgi:hypothetical protein
MPRSETVGNYYGKQALPDIKESDYIVHENLIGLELEVENFQGGNVWSRMKFWDTITDGSLRNNGREFVLKYPLGGYSLEQAMTELWANIHEGGSAFHINARTSLHVHVDLRTFTLDEVKRFFILYMVMEKSLYGMAGVGRDKNIYCPATYEAYDQNIATILRCTSLNQLDDISRNWEKYTGINMTRARDLNTVEIRIHNGTLNGSVARRWVNSILTLVKEVKEPTVTLESSVDELVSALFYRPTQSQRTNAVIDIEDGLFNVEYYTTMHRTSKAPRFAALTSTDTAPVTQEPMTTTSEVLIRTKNRTQFRETFDASLPVRITPRMMAQYCGMYDLDPEEYLWRADYSKYIEYLEQTL